MGRRKCLQDFEKGEIDAYHDQGLSISEIATKIKRSRCAVYNYFKNKKTKGQKKKIGRKNIFNYSEHKRIIKLAANKSITSREIKNKIATIASDRTISKYLLQTPCIKY